jgi:hypothetical protein
MRLILALGLVCAFDAGCNDSTPAPPAGNDMAVAAVVPTNFDSINSEVFQFSCTFSTCHTKSNARNAGNLNLQNDPMTGPVAIAQLVGQLSDNLRAKSEGKLRVKPCDADNSFLITKLTLSGDTPNDATHYGARMPASSNMPLDPAVIQAIKDWINRGALQNEPATVSGSACALADGGT